MLPHKLAEKYRALIKERMPTITTAHDSTGHWYVYKGKKYPSVTGALQLLKDPGLMNWKMNTALEYVDEHWSLARHYQHADKLEILAAAKLAPVKEFEGAGDVGRKVHDWRESWFRAWMKSPLVYVSQDFHEPIKNFEPAVTSGCRALKKFQKDTGYIPVACELYVADEELGIAGTLDDIGIMPYPIKVYDHEKRNEDGLPMLQAEWERGGYKTHFKPKLVLVDLKTSNIGDKNAYFLQVALYAKMFYKLTKIWPKEFYILHVSKTDGTYKLIPIKNMKQLIKDAVLLLKLNKSLARITEDKKKETILL